MDKTIDFEQELYNHFGQVKDFTTGMRIARYFYDMGRNNQEPVSNIWHDSNKEQPKDGSAVAVWNGKSGEIITQCVEVYPDRLWAYMDDLLYNSKEPKSDSYNREEIMRHLDELLISIAEYEKDRIIQEACDRAKNIVKCLEEPVSEELEEEIKRMIYDSYYDVAGIAIKGSSLYLKVDGLATIARHFAQWQKRKAIDKACEWLEKHCIEYWGTEAIDNGKMIDDFRKALEED